MVHDVHVYLRQALDALFRPIGDNGFWDENENKIIRALNYKILDNRKLIWMPDNSVKWRYVPFAFMGVMQWRASSISSKVYDSKIKAQLDYFMEKIEDEKTLSKIPSYGIGPLILSFSLAYKIFQSEEYRKTAWKLYYYSLRRFDFNNSEDSLLLYGWSFLYEIERCKDLLRSINNALQIILQKQDENGLFIFKNPTTKRHQNQMYALWGIGKAIEVLNKKEYTAMMEKTFEYTIKRRMLDNGAFIWEDLPLSKKMQLKFIYKIKGIIPFWELLFECHQTFFVNAVFHYYKAGGERDYNEYIKKAMKWIYGNNVLNKNLVEISGIGVPMRVMTINGKMDIKGQMFKGAYEVGSYIMALTNIAESKLDIDI